MKKGAKPPLKLKLAVSEIDRDTLIQQSNTLIEQSETATGQFNTSIVTVNSKINGTAYKNNKLASDMLTKAINVNALRCNLRAYIFKISWAIPPAPLTFSCFLHHCTQLQYKDMWLKNYTCLTGLL